MCVSKYTFEDITDFFDLRASFGGYYHVPNFERSISGEKFVSWLKDCLFFWQDLHFISPKWPQSVNLGVTGRRGKNSWNSLDSSTFVNTSLIAGLLFRLDTLKLWRSCCKVSPGNFHRWNKVYFHCAKLTQKHSNIWLTSTDVTYIMMSKQINYLP